MSENEELKNEIEQEIEDQVESQSWKEADKGIRVLKVLKFIEVKFDVLTTFLWPIATITCLFVGISLVLMLILSFKVPGWEMKGWELVKHCAVMLFCLFVGNQTMKKMIKHFSK